MYHDNNNELPRTRAEAKAVGSKRYQTGGPCKHGHVAARLTSNRCCVTCSSLRTEKWVVDNVDHLKAYRKNIYAENKDVILANWADWYAENHERELDKKRSRYIENRESALAYAKDYRGEFPEKAKEATAKWRESNPHKVKQAWQDWYAENGRERDAKRRSTPKGKMDSTMSRAIYGALKDKKAGRKWEALVGYSVHDLMRHLEKQFLPGMMWGNHGRYGWHIDHKIPLAAHNYETPDDLDFKRAWSLENLQPLWWQDNLSKGAKLDKPFQPSLAIGA